MIHNHFVIPALILAIVQQLIWYTLPDFTAAETVKAGNYRQKNLVFFVSVKIALFVLMAVQLFISLLPITTSAPSAIALTVVGYLFILFGFFLSLIALRDLGNAWTDCFHYRIKQDQKLVTFGVYRFVRHPIYLAVLLEVIGYELIVTSWLVLPIFLFLLTLTLIQIRLEDKLLTDYFGTDFTTYRSNTGSLFPKPSAFLNHLRPSKQNTA